MSEVAVAGGRTAWRGRLGTEAQPAVEIPDARRAFQLVLAAIWLLDAVLQYQSFMFTKAFGQMLAGTADGQPRGHRPADHLGREPRGAPPCAA